MSEVTLTLALLLGAGFLAAMAGRVLRLPSVTGYICAGLLLGPSGLNLVSKAALGTQLGHFTQIALMMIAFGIGEHLEFKRLRPLARSVGLIGLAETSGAFFLVAAGALIVAPLAGIGEGAWRFIDYLALALLLGAVAVATAPAATLHVMRELKAAGPLTATLMAVVAVDNGLAIMYFGVVSSLVRSLIGGGESALWAMLAGLRGIAASLALGAATGLAVDFTVHRLKGRGDMLTAGLAFLLLCGELARLGGLSPLLTGMAAGLTVVNRDRRDVRVFRVINAFEPPIYVLFFTLAGAHVDLGDLTTLGGLGLAYYLLRGLGKMAGAGLGGRRADAPAPVRRYLGLALLPQAGVAIGLVFLIQGNEALARFAAVITPVVLAGVLFSELTGPLCARLAVTRAGETGGQREKAADENNNGPPEPPAEDSGGFRLVPWTWPRLVPPIDPDGVVIFGAAHPATIAGLARMAALLAYHHGARALAVRVVEQGARPSAANRSRTGRLFEQAREEVRQLGLDLAVETVSAENAAAGLVLAAAGHKTRAILLGHPLTRSPQEFQRVVDTVAREAPCQVIVVRLVGLLHTERILVPVAGDAELSVLSHVVRALAEVGPHSVTLLRLLPSEADETEIRAGQAALEDWADREGITRPVSCRAISSESRLDTILAEAAGYDLLVMASSPHKRLSRLFFGSLAEDVAQRSAKPMLMVHEHGD
ncbi:MAG: cation:proton antiporter [Proteobacteria bacterium]|nr:cation:proton antiporter [Pseudomonadota bacterium]